MKKIVPRDRSAAMSAEDLRRRYNLDCIGKSSGNGGLNYSSSETVEVGDDGKLSVITVDTAIWGDKRPISSGGVYSITGYIENILKSI